MFSPIPAERAEQLEQVTLPGCSRKWSLGAQVVLRTSARHTPRGGPLWRSPSGSVPRGDGREEKGRLGEHQVNLGALGAWALVVPSILSQYITWSWDKESSKYAEGREGRQDQGRA